MLTIRDLSVGFRRYLGLFRQDEVTRLSNVTLDLAAGEVLAVIGGSGAGQSPLAHAGLPDARLYPGSYSDWTQQGWPVATGSDPGEPPGGPDR